MPRHVLRTAVLTAAPVVATAAVGLGTLVPAHADDSPPPVTGADSVTTEAQTDEFGGVTFIDVLANDTSPSGVDLEICRIQAPRRGLSVAEVAPNGSFDIETPNSGVGFSTGGPADEDATESLVVLPWANRAGTYTFTYWACDTEHLTPATVTVTVEKTPPISVTKTARPGRLRFANPRSSRVIVLYGGVRAERPDGQVRLAAGEREVRRVKRPAIRWIAFSPRSGFPVGEGIVRGIRLPGGFGRAAGSADAAPGVTEQMLRVWRRS